MSAVEHTGRTVDEAVEHAISEMGATREEVDVEVLQEPRQALLGLGGREAKVRVTLRAAPGMFARDAVAEVLGLMGYSGTADLQESPDHVTVTLSGRELGPVIGRQGRTLDAMEFLIGLHLARRYGRRVPLVLDAEGFRANRERALRELALEAAERAVAEGRAVALEPMEPKARRIIHLALQEHAAVRTVSEGEGDERHVVVHPRERTPSPE